MSLSTLPSRQSSLEKLGAIGADRRDRTNEAIDPVAACLLDDGARAWARLTDPSDLEAMLEADPIGRRVLVEDAGERLA